MNILICDDVFEEAEKMSGLLNSLGYSTAVFTGGTETLEYIRSGGAADVIILDIIMPGMSGIDLARTLREVGFGGEIVFLSTSNEYGPETYEVKAFHYLVKPPLIEDLKRILDEIKADHEKTDRAGLSLKISGSARFVLFRDVEYVEVIKHYVTFHLSNGEIAEIRATFTEVARQLLCDKRFIQCHQSYIVNMDSIASMMSREVTMLSGARIPISKGYPETKLRYLNRGLRGEQK